MAFEKNFTLIIKVFPKEESFRFFVLLNKVKENKQKHTLIKLIAYLR